MRISLKVFLKLFLNWFQKYFKLYITRGLINIQCCFVIDFIVCNGPEHHSTLI